MEIHPQQIENLKRLLEKALTARSEQQYEYWKKHFEKYLNKLYQRKIKDNGKH